MTDFETEYGFCKDNRLVLIVESLFAKSSTANAGAWVLEAPPLFSGNTSSFAFKATYSKSVRFGSCPKSDHFNKL